MLPAPAPFAASGAHTSSVPVPATPRGISRRTWTVRSTEDDGLAITCPNGATETYTEANVAAQPPSCGGFSASTVCTLGDCP
jgi:hypothetical protein